jgi:hypothetical protein
VDGQRFPQQRTFIDALAGRLVAAPRQLSGAAGDEIQQSRSANPRFRALGYALSSSAELWFYRRVKMNALARDGKWNPELE